MKHPAGDGAEVGVRIIFTAPYVWPEVQRGGERYVHELAAALARRGHSARILSTAPRPCSDQQLGVPVRRLRRLSPSGLRRWEPYAADVTFAVQVAALVAAQAVRVDVWHSTSLPEAALGATLRAHWPGAPRSVYSDQGLPHAALSSRHPDHRLFKPVVRDGDAYLVHTEAAAQMLVAHTNCHADVVAAGVQLASFAPGRRTLAPTVLYAGALDVARKNVPALVAAIGLARRDRADIRLRLVGPGQPPKDLPDFVDVSGPLPPSALADSYARSWLTALPARFEAFGLTLLESLASGTPGLALANERGPSSILTEATGVLAASDDPELLSAAVLEGLDLAGRSTTSSDCRERASEYDWDAVVAPRVEGIYERVLA